MRYAHLNLVRKRELLVGEAAHAGLDQGQCDEVCPPAACVQGCPALLQDLICCPVHTAQALSSCRRQVISGLSQLTCRQADVRMSGGPYALPSML